VNPSAANWIPKYISILRSGHFIKNLSDQEELYESLLKAGFLYGVSLRAIPDRPVSPLRLTREELTKVNLFHALLHTHFRRGGKTDYHQAVDHILKFYEQLDRGKQGFLRWLTLSNGKNQRLEKVLAARLQESSSLLHRDVTGLLAYALIYVDVLAYEKAHLPGFDLAGYTTEIERTVIACCYLGLLSKKKKNKYDRLLIELFETSTEYLMRDNKKKPASLSDLKDLKGLGVNVKRYLLDLSCIAVWDDHTMDQEEFGYLLELNASLGFEKERLEYSLEQLSSFMSSNDSSVKLFELANPVKHFYRQSTAAVKLLILRNRKRLQQELNESSDLLKLLSQSTRRELSPEEKSQVRDQLLDICKTIPSLTIFLLPGGTVLLPILVKFIPKLLPSSFHENRLER